MFESFIVTLREGTEAALAVGLVVITLRKTGRLTLLPWVFGGLALAAVGSVAGGVFLTRLPVDQQVFEGVLMMAASVLVGTAIVWMWRTARQFSERIRTQVESLSGSSAGFRRNAKAGLGLFVLTFLLVFREGVETVIFLGAIGLNTEGILTLLGVLGGVVLSLVFGIAFVRGSLQIDIGRFFAVTGIVLLILAFQLFVGGLHEFSEGGVVSFGPREMAIVGPIVKNNTLFLIAMLALPFLLLFVPGEATRKEWTRVEGLTSPDRRLGLARLRRGRFWRRSAAVLSLVAIASAAIQDAYSRISQKIDPPQMVEAVGDKISLPIALFEDGNLHRLGVTIGSSRIRFLVLKRTDGTFAAAFDACRICGAKGYVQKKRRFVCLNCAADINAVTIGQSGGCNPIPIPSTRDGDRLILLVEDLKKEETLFK